MTEPWTPAEPQEVLAIFSEMLAAATGDGAAKRRSGLHPRSWKVDGSHETALFSHLHRWKNDEEADPDSGAHPLVHAAWRALAIAYQETHGLQHASKHRKGEPQGSGSAAQRPLGVTDLSGKASTAQCAPDARTGPLEPAPGAYGPERGLDQARRAVMAGVEARLPYRPTVEAREPTLWQRWRAHRDHRR